MDIVHERPPLPYLAALRALAGCSARDEVLQHPHLQGGDEAWWRLTAVG